MRREEPVPWLSIRAVRAGGASPPARHEAVAERPAAGSLEALDDAGARGAWREHQSFSSVATSSRVPERTRAPPPRARGRGRPGPVRARSSVWARSRPSTAAASRPATPIQRHREDTRARPRAARASPPPKRPPRRARDRARLLELAAAVERRAQRGEEARVRRVGRDRLPRAGDRPRRQPRRPPRARAPPARSPRRAARGRRRACRTSGRRPPARPRRGLVRPQPRDDLLDVPALAESPATTAASVSGAKRPPAGSEPADRGSDSRIRNAAAFEEVSTRLPSGLNDAEWTHSTGPRSKSSRSRDGASQRHSVRSAEPDRKRWPSGLKATAVTHPRWPWMTATSLPVPVSHMRTVRSSERRASRSPSTRNRPRALAPSCRPRPEPLAGGDLPSPSVLSAEADATVRPSGERDRMHRARGRRAHAAGRPGVVPQPHDTVLVPEAIVVPAGSQPRTAPASPASITARRAGAVVLPDPHVPSSEPETIRRPARNATEVRSPRPRMTASGSPVHAFPRH